MWKSLGILTLYSSYVRGVKYSLLLIALSAAAVSQEQLTDFQASELEHALDDAIREVRPDYNDRISLADRVVSASRNDSEFPARIILKAKYVKAFANMRLGNMSASAAIVQDLCPSIPPGQFQILRFRCDYLDAALHLIRGEKEESLRLFENLTTSIDPIIPPDIIARVKIGYGIVLNENGRAAAAVDIYEQVMLAGIRLRDDLLTLSAGNNLIVILITMKDYSSAEEALDELAPVIARNPESILRGSLLLHKLELTRVQGDPAVAEAGFLEFVASPPDSTPLMMGSAYKLLADSQRDLGRYDEALGNARIAARLLVDQSHELVDVKLTTASIHLAAERPEEALVELDQIDPEQENVPARRVYYFQLKTEALMAVLNDEETQLSFREFLAAADAQANATSVTKSQYLEAKLAVASQGFALQQAKEQAELESQRVSLLRSRNQMTLVMSVLFCLVFVGSVSLIQSRRVQKRRIAEKQAVNEKLEALVTEKTALLNKSHAARETILKELERKKRVESIGLLASNFAHDFNNLLQVVSVSNQTQKDENASQDERTRMLELSNQSLDNGTQVLRQLLAYTRQQTLASELIDIDSYVQQTSALMVFSGGEENQVSISNQTKGIAVFADRALLTNSILNLIRNAVDSIDGHGEITVHFDEVSQNRFKSEWDMADGKYLCVHVRDNGHGMTDAERDRATEPFYTTKDLHLGSGLGLSSVYGFVKQSGGDLRIESEVGGGTSVLFCIPFANRNGELTSASEDSSRTSMRFEGRALVVEDNALVAEGVGGWLDSLGLDVEMVESGESAQELLRTDSGFRVVVTDMRMGGAVDGLTLARWVRNENPQIAVLLMTGFSQQSISSREFRVLPKPFSRDTLVDALTEVLINNGRPVHGQPI